MAPFSRVHRIVATDPPGSGIALSVAERVLLCVLSCASREFVQSSESARRYVDVAGMAMIGRGVLCVILLLANGRRK